MLKISRLTILAAILIGSLTFSWQTSADNAVGSLRKNFSTPPDSARPGVYWYFMDGCLSKTQMTKDLESMRDVGIGSVLFLEVNLGLPRGHVDYFSPEWQGAFLHAVRECERLGIEMTLGVGPGWSGSGGPWVKGSESMRHLVGSETTVSGNGTEQDIVLAVPRPKRPYFGEGVFTPELRERWEAYYEDVIVLAVPADMQCAGIEDSDEKALYYRAPFSSVKGVSPVLPEPHGDEKGIPSDKVIDVTRKMDGNGILHWNVPDGQWKIIRMGMRNNGAVTRPAPMPGLGFECDKFDSTAFKEHFFNSFGKLLSEIAPSPEKKGGLKCLHMDSWEMGAQNWSDDFASEFEKRRGYSPDKYLPVYLGICIDDMETSERFLRDVRKTAEELVLENHAYYIRKLAHEYGLQLSIEPYDMTPLSDMRLCEAADIPMCEFWTPRNGYNTTYGCFEATSVAHVKGRSTVAAEAFTTNSGENNGFAYFPGNIKAQGDWAFAAGINKFVYHTFVHKYFENENARPGMTMGRYGVNWDRGQTWWHLSGEYHEYVARCSYMLRQGRTVADILYLTGEDAPYVFRYPDSAVRYDNPFYPDRKEFNFDAVTPATLIAEATVRDGKIVFESGATYEIMVLPSLDCMSVQLIDKIDYLVANGATIIGMPPANTGSLTDAGKNDRILMERARKIWGSLSVPSAETVRQYGEGKIYWGGRFSENDGESLYPTYEITAGVLRRNGIPEDYDDVTDKIRYTHRTSEDTDIFFLSNTTDERKEFTGKFRTVFDRAEIWNPVTGEMSGATVDANGGQKEIALALEGNQSCFVVFSRQKSRLQAYSDSPAVVKSSIDIGSGWTVNFDPAWGGPEEVRFETLTDWKDSDDERIRYYSGSAFYHRNFRLEKGRNDRITVRFESVHNIAAIRVNGKYVTTLWTAPWEADITEYVKNGDNEIEVEVANLWVNRIIRDMGLKEEKTEPGKWPLWLFNKGERNSERLSYATYRHYRKDSPLVSSGLIGKAEIVIE